MSGLDQIKSPLDRALEELDSKWQTCTLDITFSGMATVDQLGILGLQLGVNITDTGKQIVFTKSNGDDFNREMFGNMLSHYFEQFPHMEVAFTEAEQNGA